MNRRVSSNSSSVSPGNPTITSAPIAASGINSRASRTRAFVVLRPVSSMHPPQHRVRARLQRNVDVLRDPRRVGHELQQIVRPVHRLDRTKPQPLHVRLSGERAEDRPAAFRSPAPGPNARD